jgi:flavin-dependent dehydrogenase
MKKESHLPNGGQAASSPLVMSGWDFIWVIPRRQLDAWVVDAARRTGATVLDGRKVMMVEPAHDAVTVHGHSAAGRNRTPSMC